MKTSKLLVVMMILQLVIIAGQWLGTPSVIGTAQGQQIDAARDRVQTLEAMRSIDGKMDKLIDLLDSGKLQVQVVAPDDSKGRSAAR
jgi:hypothetical protein